MKNCAGLHHADVAAQELGLDAEGRDPPQTSRCSECRAPIPAEASFCGHCGAKAAHLSIIWLPMNAS